jgi:hypothetical protein|tara:strand:- start:2833 stop:3894 length:1062 start_codon:yes stop_codon:yes gene_type:complete
MYQFITASKDASIYLQQPSQNTGLDEILEVSKTYYGSLKDIAHTLIRFDTTDLVSSIASGEVTMSAADMILRECESIEIPMDYTLYAYAVTQSWDMGIGTRFDKISTDGTTWNSVTTGQDWLSLENHSADTTGSYNGKGGTWFTGSFSSQTFSYESSDVSMDVKTTMDEWVAGTLPNEGFIIKHDTTLENDTNDYGQLKFFSKETNTIYQPKLRIGWDDSLFSTGSLTELTSDDIHVTFKRLKSKYRVGSTPEIKVFGREKYPLKTYTNTYAYNDVKYLPSTTYYQVKDIITDEVIIPFSDYTKVSCDSTGNFFKLNLTNWETQRDYYLEIKVDRDGTIEYFEDKDLTFTIEK